MVHHLLCYVMIVIYQLHPLTSPRPPATSSYLPRLNPMARAWASALAPSPPPGAPYPASPCPRHDLPSPPHVQAVPVESIAIECSDPHAICTADRISEELSGKRVRVEVGRRFRVKPVVGVTWGARGVGA